MRIKSARGAIAGEMEARSAPPHQQIVQREIMDLTNHGYRDRDESNWVM